MPGSESNPSDLLLSDYARELLRKVTEARREAGAGEAIVVEGTLLPPVPPAGGGGLTGRLR